MAFALVRRVCVAILGRRVLTVRRLLWSAVALPSLGSGQGIGQTQPSTLFDGSSHLGWVRPMSQMGSFASFEASSSDVGYYPAGSTGRRNTYPRWKDGVYSVISEESRLSVSSQAHLNKWCVSSTNGHVKPWELKPQQKDLMQVLRRPVETTAQHQTFV